MKLRHVVLFGFGKAQSPATLAEVMRRFGELEALVPGIDDFEWGANSSPEGLDHGQRHVFLLTFASARARDAYLVHPDHGRLCELGPAICVLGDGSGLLGRNQDTGRFGPLQELFDSIRSFCRRADVAPATYNVKP
jgi:hypothetical protein